MKLGRGHVEDGQKLGNENAMHKQKMMAMQGLETAARAPNRLVGYTVRILHIDGKERRLNTLVAVKDAPKEEGTE